MTMDVDIIDGQNIIISFIEAPIGGEDRTKDLSSEKLDENLCSENSVKILSKEVCDETITCGNKFSCHPFAAGDNVGAFNKKQKHNCIILEAAANTPGRGGQEGDLDCTWVADARHSKYQVTAILAATSTYAEVLTETFAMASIQWNYVVVIAIRSKEGRLWFER